MNPLFSIAYCPPVSYLNKCFENDIIVIDKHEHFIKQTYRNRCNIYGANGKQSLIIPVSHDNLSRTPVSEIKITYDSPWNKIHWKSITSAYRNAPYFEYYEQDFQNLFDAPGELLFDFNINLLRLIFDSLKQKIQITFTEKFESIPENHIDLRNTFHPKKYSQLINPYHQVFSDRFGFINDLSAVDFLFNMGPIK